MENRTHIENIPFLAPLLNKETGKTEYPQPHETYIDKALNIIMEGTLGIECYLWVDYMLMEKTFRINFLKSKNISPELGHNLERKIFEVIAISPIPKH